MIVAFDADDTLWHNEDQFQQVHREFERILEPWAPADVVDAHLLAVETRNLRRYGYGAKSFMLSMTETALELSDSAVPAAAIRRILEMGHEILDRPIDLLDGVPDVLDALNGHRLMIITKGDLYAQHARIVESGLAERFWRIDVVPRKDPATYTELLRRHGVALGEFVMVGNSLASDVLPVIEIGGRAVHVPYHVTWAHEHVDDHTADVPTIGSLRELPALIEAWS